MGSDYQRRARNSSTTSNDERTRVPGPGKHTLVEAAYANVVQRKETGAAPNSEVRAAADRGTAGPAVTLPHGETIQRLFGRHDVSEIRAHTDGAAQQASRDMRAKAYATGHRVAFDGSPDLHTAAHEAAHVVQQRAGVQLQGGVGQSSDAYERHADAVADRVVAGQSAEALLGEMTGGALDGSSVGPVQRKEVASDTQISGIQDWTTADRTANSSRWAAACLHNLEAADSAQYVKVVERRDFYKWFYETTAKRGFTTRWALAAYVVANGAHQIADMDEQHWLANDALSMTNVELQGAMREGNQVIFDNVLPKLKALYDGAPLTKKAALDWDKKVLAEEQTLVQALYARLTPESLAKLDRIARKQGMAGVGAWWTGEDKVAAGPYNNAGKVPGFNQPDMTSIGDRWRYGMELGNQFTPGGTGFKPSSDAMPGVGAEYQNGTEFAKVDTRHNLHELDAWLNPNRLSRTGAGANIQTIIRTLTPFEQQQILLDRSPDGWAYSAQFAQFSAITEALVRQALPSDRTSSAAVTAFISRYNAARAALPPPPLPMGF